MSSTDVGKCKALCGPRIGRVRLYSAFDEPRCHQLTEVCAAFLSIENSRDGGSEVVKLDLSGKVLDTYCLNRMMLHDVDIGRFNTANTDSESRFLGVGTMLESSEGIQLSGGRAEKRIFGIFVFQQTRMPLVNQSLRIVYNMDKKEIEGQVPILNEVRSVTMARIGEVALVSYERKVMSNASAVGDISFDDRV
jgi:WD repeat-containing protein 26